MPKAGRGRGSSSSGSKPPRSSSTGRVQKGKQTNASSSAIAHGSVGLDEIDTNLLHANYRPPRSPIRTRQQSGASRGNSGQQQKQQQGTNDTSTPTTTTTTTNVPTSNEFEMLTDDDDGSSTDSDVDVFARKRGNEKKCNTPRERRPPPIYVMDTLADDVDELLEGLEYCLKISKSSVKVITLDRKNYDEVVKELKLQNFKFFTFEPADKVPTKIVLQGYKDRPIDELKEHLLDAGVKPRDIKIFSRKTSVTGTHTLYLLYFDRGSVKIQDLRRIKSLDGFWVNWRFYTKHPTDAAQCHRCQKFGHGSRNCYLQPHCVKCGETHLSEACSLPRKADLGGNAEQLKSRIKCANCGGNHTSNYRGCAARKAYLEEQEKRKKSAASTRPPQRTSSTVPAAGTFPTSFSAFPPGWGRSYANVAASGGDNSAQQITGEDLFTLPEFFALAGEMMTRFRTCRNKAEQFLALGELMLKHIYKG